MKEIYTKFPDLLDAKKEKNMRKKKKKFIQDNIYVIQQFTYVYGVTEISLFLRKNTRCGSTVFSLKTT